jgi:hypothetical protein
MIAGGYPSRVRHVGATSAAAGIKAPFHNLRHTHARPSSPPAFVDAEGKAKYTGVHALRHFYASWCINRRIDGGLELPLKLVQARLGHASIQMTADRYGHRAVTTAPNWRQQSACFSGAASRRRKEGATRLLTGARHKATIL